MYNAPGFSQLEYDANGHLSKAVDTGGSRTFTYANNAQGLVLHRTEAQAGNAFEHLYYYAAGRRIGDVSTDPTDKYRVSYAEQLAQSLTDTDPDKFKDFKPVTSADFDQNYEPINANYPSASASSYTARGGETLRAIAQSVWGDSAMWFLIAEANGLRDDVPLVAGQVLVIPNKVTNIHNNAGTVRPYNPGEVIGHIDPSQPEEVPVDIPDNPANWGSGGDRMGDYAFIDTWSSYNFSGVSPNNITYGRGLDAYMQAVAKREAKVQANNDILKDPKGDRTKLQPVDPFMRDLRPGSVSFDVRGANASEEWHGNAWQAVRAYGVVGNAIGSSLASPSAPDQSAAESARLNRYEAAAAAADAGSTRVVDGYDFGASQRYFDSVASAPGVQLADASRGLTVDIAGVGWKGAFKLGDGTQVWRSGMDADDPRRMIADLALNADAPNVPGYVYHADEVFERLGTRNAYYLPAPVSRLAAESLSLGPAVDLTGLSFDLPSVGAGVVLAASPSVINPGLGLGVYLGAQSATSAMYIRVPAAGPYGQIAEPTFQAHHLNQGAVYNASIPYRSGQSILLRGDAIRDAGSPHYQAHASLENWWESYRTGQNRGSVPTNAQYGQALRQSLLDAGLSPAGAAQYAEVARQQRLANGQADGAPVPRVPRRMPQPGGNVVDADLWAARGLAKNLAMVGRGATVVGAALDSYSLYSEFQQSVQTGDYSNTYREGVRIAGGWAGAYAAGSLGAEIGAGVGMLFTPAGAVVGGFIGGLIGGGIGYFGGGHTAVQATTDFGLVPRLPRP